MGLAHVVGGRKQQARTVLKRFEKAMRDRYGPATYLGILYAAPTTRNARFNGWRKPVKSARMD